MHLSDPPGRMPLVGLFSRAGAAFRRARFLLLYSLAFLWRRLLLRTTFIAITGSVGKTTAKECLAAILSARGPTAKTLYNGCDLGGVCRTVLRVRPWHRFAVVEIGTDEPGMIRRAGRLVRPHVAVVLAIERVHSDVFPTLEATAEEKAAILPCLPAGGTAILNGDNPLVRRMGEGLGRRVLMFGRSPGLDLWADAIASRWPGRLAFRAHDGEEIHPIETNLVGEQWLNSVLASMLAARVCGISIPTSAEALRQVQPFMGRMQPARVPTGAVFLRDDKGGAISTYDAAFKVLEEASAGRRVAVLGNVTDGPSRNERTQQRLRALGRAAARVAELVVFVGESSRHGVKGATQAGMAADRVHWFRELEPAAAFLRGELKEGDLVLLKGRGTDHVSRIFFAQFGPIGCWKAKCPKRILCDICPELGITPGSGRR